MPTGKGDPVPGKIKFTFDEKRNVLFTEDHFELRDKRDVEEFFRINEAESKKHPGKFYLVSDINGLKIHAAVIGLYGERGKELTARFVLGQARYATEPFARMALRAAYSRAGVPCEIFNTKEEALKALGL